MLVHRLKEWFCGHEFGEGREWLPWSSDRHVTRVTSYIKFCKAKGCTFVRVKKEKIVWTTKTYPDKTEAYKDLK